MFSERQITHLMVAQPVLDQNLRNPGFPKDPPLLVWECIGVPSTMERFAGASFGGRDGGIGEGSGWQCMKTWGFLTRGFAISDSEIRSSCLWSLSTHHSHKCYCNMQPEMTQTLTPRREVWA